MEDPQSALTTHHLDAVQRFHRTNDSTSIPTSPEHSRARSKKTRAFDQTSKSKARPQIRRRESYADGTRRGRSRTRSVSPGSAKRRVLRRRRSRSPSRSCSTSATETQSPSAKRKRRSRFDDVGDEDAGEVLAEVVIRDDSRESMRSRSKRRKKYRRRSDYAGPAAEIGQESHIRNLRSMKAAGDTQEEGRPYNKTDSFESVLEEDEDRDGMTHHQ